MNELYIPYYIRKRNIGIKKIKEMGEIINELGYKYNDWDKIFEELDRRYQGDDLILAIGMAEFIRGVEAGLIKVLDLDEDVDNKEVVMYG